MRGRSLAFNRRTTSTAHFNRRRWAHLQVLSDNTTQCSSVRCGWSVPATCETFVQTTLPGWVKNNQTWWDLWSSVWWQCLTRSSGVCVFPWDRRCCVLHECYRSAQWWLTSISRTKTSAQAGQRALQEYSYICSVCVYIYTLCVPVNVDYSFFFFNENSFLICLYENGWHESHRFHTGPMARTSLSIPYIHTYMHTYKLV
jgi:hypothetical protein